MCLISTHEHSKAIYEEIFAESTTITAYKVLAIHEGNKPASAYFWHKHRWGPGLNKAQGEQDFKEAPAGWDFALEGGAIHVYLVKSRADINSSVIESEEMAHRVMEVQVRAEDFVAADPFGEAAFTQVWVTPEAWEGVTK